MAIIKKDFDVVGMRCTACAGGINMLLGSTNGIKSATISWDNKSGIIEYDNLKINLEEIQKAISDIGYSVTPK